MPRYASRRSVRWHHRVVTDGDGNQDTGSRRTKIVFVCRNVPLTSTDVFVGRHKVVQHVGRTQITLERKDADPWRSQDSVLYHDADSARLLLTPPGRDAWPAASLRLIFTYHRNRLDETDARDHRFDRVVEKRRGDDSPEHGL
jgi:hypothetical protein